MSPRPLGGAGSERPRTEAAASQRPTSGRGLLVGRCGEVSRGPHGAGLIGGGDPFGTSPARSVLGDVSHVQGAQPSTRAASSVFSSGRSSGRGSPAAVSWNAGTMSDRSAAGTTISARSRSWAAAHAPTAPTSCTPRRAASSVSVSHPVARSSARCAASCRASSSLCVGRRPRGVGAGAIEIDPVYSSSGLRSASFGHTMVSDSRSTVTCANSAGSRSRSNAGPKRYGSRSRRRISAGAEGQHHQVAAARHLDIDDVDERAGIRCEVLGRVVGGRTGLVGGLGHWSTLLSSCAEKVLDVGTRREPG
jgi:hypothetical protein